MGCFGSKPVLGGHFASHEQLARETHFSVDEIYALEELFKELSNRLHKDGLIHKDEFALALFKLHGHNNLFVDRVFKIFDSKHNDVVDFEEFVRALSVFHPKAPLNEKADCEALTACEPNLSIVHTPFELPVKTRVAFRIYDLKDTGVIERDEVKRLLSALLQENPAIDLSDDEIDEIVNQTFEEADLVGDEIISLEEWHTLVINSPDIIGYMTLPVLNQVTVLYPSFIFNTRRKYDKSIRGDPSTSSRFAASEVDRSLHLRVGQHSFDKIPRQQAVTAM